MLHKVTTQQVKRKLNSFVIFSLCSIMITLRLHSAQSTGRMVRLCIASVDPVKLSSQCVMCNRREFPLTAIGCTGIDRMNDLIANPLSVRQALCLINNCRKQVPHVRPEPYHGSVTQAGRANYPSTSGSRNYEMMSPYGNGGNGGYSATSLPLSSMSRYRANQYTYGSMADSPSMASRLTPDTFGLGSSSIPNGMGLPPNALPYALVPEPYTPSLFGSRKIKASLVPLFA